jgi:AraC-like DNA-binding protein
MEPMPEARARTLYIYAQRRDFLRRCTVVAITPLLAAIVDHLHQHEATAHLVAVAIEQLAALREQPLFLPRLSSARTRRVADVLSADPADTPRIHDLAAALGVSDRTLERAFAADAGMSLGEWRQRSRISRAIGLLAGGLAVKDVALEVGYESPSAFVAAFKKYVGKTPGKI